MSNPGVLSLSPVIKARNAGSVAQCNTMAANQPRVSADSLARLLERNSRTAMIVIGNLKGINVLRKRCDDQFGQFGVFSIQGLHSPHDKIMHP